MNWYLILIALVIWLFTLVAFKKERRKQFSKNVLSLNPRTLLAVSLVLIAFDTLTAFISYKIVPNVFIRFEQNELIRWAFTTGHMEGYLIAEANAIIFIVAIFAVSVWTQWVCARFALLLCLAMLALAVSSNVIGMAVLPNSMTFSVLMFISVFIVAAALFNPRSLRWLKR